MTDYQHWMLDINQNIATLTLTRADNMNTLTVETLHELRDISKRLQEDQDVWVIILQSDGDHFSAGLM